MQSVKRKKRRLNERQKLKVKTIKADGITKGKRDVFAHAVAAAPTERRNRRTIGALQLVIKIP